MRNLIQFLWKYNVLIFFLLLESLAFALIVQNNSYHRSAFLNSSNGFTSSIQEWVDEVNTYFHLKDENKKLAFENADLRKKLNESYIISSNKVFEVRDSLFRQEYTYTSAKIIKNSYLKRNNILHLNEGSEQGIKPHMGIIDAKGVVGIVRDVSDNFSTVYSVLNSKTTINAKLGRSGNTGIAKWEGNDYKVGTLDFIPSHVEIELGDTVFTSGNSAIFPEGIPIGKVSHSQLNPGESFYSISFEYFTDYNKLQHVYVVINLMKDEIEAMTKEEDE